MDELSEDLVTWMTSQEAELKVTDVAVATLVEREVQTEQLQTLADAVSARERDVDGLCDRGQQLSVASGSAVMPQQNKQIRERFLRLQESLKVGAVLTLLLKVYGLSL